MMKAYTTLDTPGPMTTAESKASGRLRVSASLVKSKKVILKKHLKKQKHVQPTE